MNKIITLFSFFIVILMSACTEKENITEELAFDTLTFQKLCGWCTPGASIILTNKQKVKFTLEDCDGVSERKKRNLTNEEIQSINEAFDLATLTKIDLNKCGACYDGCDDTITIEASSGEDAHIIQYDSTNYTELEEIQPLIDIITIIRESFE